MKRLAIPTLVLAVFPLVGLLLLSSADRNVAEAHCEVPCGIFADQRRFEQMLEDTATIRKAMVQINELAEKNDAQSKNQLVRWINTKEDHAKHIQHTIAQYFMAQRIKTSQADYVDRLKSSHAVMQAAMKAKQTVDVAQADALKASILAFHKVYEPNAGKKAHRHGHGGGKGTGGGGGKGTGGGPGKGGGR